MIRRRPPRQPTTRVHRPMHQHLSLPLLALALGASAAAQQEPPSQQQLQEQRAARLARPLFTKAPWLFDLDAARAAAQKDDKPIFAYFTRSSGPCLPCDKLEDDVLSTAAFAEFGKSVILFAHNTSGVEGEKYP